MWIFLNDAFLSIVDPGRQGPRNGDYLLVRARAKGDIQRVFPKAVVHKLPNRDYEFRAFVPRPVVAKAIAKQVAGIDYTNFKNSVAEDCRHTAYARAWGVMYGFQCMLAGQTPESYDEARRRELDDIRMPLFGEDVPF